jgi:hypothetical protein
MLAGTTFTKRHQGQQGKFFELIIPDGTEVEGTVSV